MLTLTSTTTPIPATIPIAPVSGSHGKRTEKWNPLPSQEQPGKQEAHECVSIRDPLRTSLLERQTDTKKKTWKTRASLKVTGEELKALQNSIALVQHYKDLIQHHVAMRVALFFQQSVICYNTPFHYEIDSTDGQFFEAPTLNVTSGKETKKIKYQAAHSGTIPSLKACLRSDFEQQGIVGMEPTYFSFLKDSHSDNLQNSTVGLPDFVNKVDTLIDGQSRSKDGLRRAAIDLINKVAQAQLTPVEATCQFLGSFKEKLQTRPNRSKKMTPEKKEVIKLYQEQLDMMIAQASISFNTKGKHPFFDFLLGLNVVNEDPDDIPIIRDIVFSQKLALIREAQLAESKIQEIINNCHPGWSRPDKHFAKLSLVYHVQNDLPLKCVLEKLFCVSVASIQQDKGLCEDLSKHYQNNDALYSNILRDIRVAVREFRKNEQNFQGRLLRDFRTKLRHFTQKALSNKVNDVVKRKIFNESQKTSPNQAELTYLKSVPKSPATISRLENSGKVLSLRYAQIICEALKIQPGYFFSSFFASLEA